MRVCVGVFFFLSVGFGCWCWRCCWGPGKDDAPLFWLLQNSAELFLLNVQVF